MNGVTLLEIHDWHRRQQASDDAVSGNVSMHGRMADTIAATLRQQAGRVDAFAPIPEAKDAPTDELWNAYNAFNERYRGFNTQQALRDSINTVLASRAALAQNTQGEAQCRGPGWCEACSRARGCCFQGERCDRRDCPCPKVLGAELRACVHAERARVPELARALVDTIDNECERVTSDAVWSAKERLQEQLAAAPSQRAEVNRG